MHLADVQRHFSRAGRRGPFDINKLERGIQKSLEKRPVSQASVEEILHQLEDEAAMKGKSTHEIVAQDLERSARAEWWSSGTPGSQPARGTSTSDGGVRSTAGEPAGRGTGAP